MNNYYVLEPSYFRLDGGAMYGIIPRPLWEKVSPPDEEGRIDLALRLLLIERKTSSGRKLILIDTGIGDYHDDTFDERFHVTNKNSPMENALHHIGISSDEITDLIVSHLHFDHVGGIGTRDGDSWRPVFKNATLHLHQSHYEYSKNPTPRDAGSFRSKEYEPIIDYYKKNKKIAMHDGGSGRLIEDGDYKLQYRCSHGHTPHLMHPYDDKFIYLADLIPTSNHIKIPWVMGYDISPGISSIEKGEFLKFIHDHNLNMIFEHDPLYWGGKISQDNKGRYAIGDKYNKKDDMGYGIDLNG